MRGARVEDCEGQGGFRKVSTPASLDVTTPTKTPAAQRRNTEPRGCGLCAQRRGGGIRVAVGDLSIKFRRP
eukprot:5458364-Pyramimonas_sp.AAC.2